MSRAAFIMSGIIGLGLAAVAFGRQDPFVGQPGAVGSFEASDPVLTDEVMEGVIPSGQDWFLFGPSGRAGV